MKRLTERAPNTIMDNMKEKIEPFHKWLVGNNITLMKFASTTGLGVSTAASLRSKSVNGIRTVLHRGTARSIRTAYPNCPLLQTAVIL